MDWKTRTKEYREHSGINFSGLKTLAFSPKLFKRGEKEEEKDGMILGSALECYLCFGEEAFYESYYIPKATAPTGQMLEFCKYLVRNGIEASEDAYRHVGFVRDSYPVVMEKFEKIRVYVDEILENKEKTAISSETMSKIVYLCKKVRANKFVSHLFENSDYQVPMYVFDKELGIYKKGLYDIFKEDSGGLPLIVDLKTTSLGIQSFYNSMLRYRYDMQASWYAHLLGKPCKFQFLVVDTAYDEEPIIVECSDETLKRGRFGFVTPEGRKIEGWEKLLSNYIEHLKYDQWDYPIETYKNNGIVVI